MALLNQGFVRSLNLDEIEDAFKAINNLAGGSITNDLVIFANNSENVTKLKLITETQEPVDFSVSSSTDTEGTTFEFVEKISTFGNGDPVSIKRMIKIQSAVHNPTLDTLFITVNESLTTNERTRLEAGDRVTLEETYFELKTTQLNGKSYKVQSATTTQIILEDIGFPDDYIGDFDPDGPSNGLDNYPYLTSFGLDLPTVSSEALAYDKTYFVCFSNAIDRFRLGYNFARTEQITQINFISSLSRSIVLERSNTCTKENLQRLARPIFEDQDFTYDNSVLSRTFNGNFVTLENYLDSANFFRFKKYLSNEDNIFLEPELSLEGNLFSNDPSEFNSTPSDLIDPDSPGIFILDTDLSTIEPVNIVKTRAYSDNTQPWELDGSTNTLEYQVLRDKITGDALNDSLQEMQIGNLIFADRAASGKLVIESLQNVSYIVGIPGTTEFNDPNNDKFTHKFPVLIEGESYSICLGTAPVTA